MSTPDTEDLPQRLRDTPNWMRESFGSWKDCVLKYDRAPFEAADEIERLRAALAAQAEAHAAEGGSAESEQLRETMADILSRTAVALRGTPPPRRRWGWHDLPERAAAAIAAIDVMQRAAKSAAADTERLDWLLDNGLVFHMRHDAPGLATMDREGIDESRGALKGQP